LAKSHLLSALINNSINQLSAVIIQHSSMAATAASSKIFPCALHYVVSKKTSKLAVPRQPVNLGPRGSRSGK
jgi:hypothetical protein